MSLVGRYLGVSFTARGKCTQSRRHVVPPVGSSFFLYIELFRLTDPQCYYLRSTVVQKYRNPGFRPEKDNWISILLLCAKWLQIQKPFSIKMYLEVKYKYINHEKTEDIARTLKNGIKKYR